MIGASPDAWQAIEVWGIGVSFRFPRLTSDGQDVLVDDVRIHVQSRDGREVYLEVSRRLEVTAAEAYQEECTFLTDRHAAKVTPLVPATFAGWPAQTFSFSWGQKQRAVVYVERAQWLYRVVHDPTSALDRRILDTIRID